jgi:membrane protease YdiL (CAAX protease family)
MPPQRDTYLQAARHPWSCVLFVLPLLATYEVGVFVLGPAQPEALRNGADVWLRGLLACAGLRHWFWAPVLLTLTLLAWSWLRRARRPREFVGVWVGMVLESAVFALALWGGFHLLLPVLERLDMAAAAAEFDPAVQQMISFLGAGIYEETLFRLLLFPALLWALRLLDLPGWCALALAALLSALAFALAHHVGPHGETLEAWVFVFRTAAGLYFAALYCVRGFGVAVGAHAGYDVLVGLLVDV